MHAVSAIAAVLALGIGAGTASAQSLDGWRGACVGDDWTMWNDSGSYVIVPGKCA